MLVKGLAGKKQEVLAKLTQTDGMNQNLLVGISYQAGIKLNIPLMANLRAGVRQKMLVEMKAVDGAKMEFLAKINQMGGVSQNHLLVIKHPTGTMMLTVMASLGAGARQKMLMKMKVEDGTRQELRLAKFNRMDGVSPNQVMVIKYPAGTMNITWSLAKIMRTAGRKPKVLKLVGLVAEGGEEKM